MKSHNIFIFLVLTLSFTLVSAQLDSGLVESDDLVVSMTRPTVVTNFSAQNTNASEWWITNLGSMDNVNGTQFQLVGARFALDLSWLNSFVSAINPFDQSLNTTDDVTFDNLTVSTITELGRGSNSIPSGFDVIISHIGNEALVIDNDGNGDGGNEILFRSEQSNGAESNRSSIFSDRIASDATTRGTLTFRTNNGTALQDAIFIDENQKSTFYGDTNTTGDIYGEDDLIVVDAIDAGGLITATRPVDDYGICHANGDIEICSYTGSGSGWWGTTTNHSFCLYVDDGGCAFEVDTSEGSSSFNFTAFGDLSTSGGNLEIDGNAEINSSVSDVLTLRKTGTSGSSDIYMYTPKSDGSDLLRARIQAGRTASTSLGGNWRVYTTSSAGVSASRLFIEDTGDISMGTNFVTPNTNLHIKPTSAGDGIRVSESDDTSRTSVTILGYANSGTVSTYSSNTERTRQNSNGPSWYNTPFSFFIGDTSGPTLTNASRKFGVTGGDSFFGGNVTVSGDLNVSSNITLANGGVIWDNATCTFIASPDGTTVQEICNA